MASAYKGDDEVCISWLGDGTSAQGDYHYALNFASTFKPPVILNVVNNQWAISTHANLATGGRTFAERGLAYDIPSIRVDGNDFLALYSVTKWARDRGAAGLGATHIEVYTYRAGGHSSSDDPSAYRPNDEFKCWPGGDPIERLKAHLIKNEMWDEKRDAALAQKIDDEVMTSYKAACEFGDLASGPYPPASTIFTEVYETVPWHVQEQREELGK
jgi:2-oxoisovalerate dehydrogenase E1 component alpha subunit